MGFRTKKRGRTIKGRTKRKGGTRKKVGGGLLAWWRKRREDQQIKKTLEEMVAKQKEQDEEQKENVTKNAKKNFDDMQEDLGMTKKFYATDLDTGEEKFLANVPIVAHGAEFYSDGMKNFLKKIKERKEREIRVSAPTSRRGGKRKKKKRTKKRKRAKKRK
jgi:hypothetical protein